MSWNSAKMAVIRQDMRRNSSRIKLLAEPISGLPPLRFKLALLSLDGCYLRYHWRVFDRPSHTVDNDVAEAHLPSSPSALLPILQLLVVVGRHGADQPVAKALGGNNLDRAGKRQPAFRDEII